MRGRVQVSVEGKNVGAQWERSPIMCGVAGEEDARGSNMRTCEKARRSSGAVLVRRQDGWQAWGAGGRPLATHPLHVLGEV